MQKSNSKNQKKYTDNLSHLSNCNAENPKALMIINNEPIRSTWIIKCKAIFNKIEKAKDEIEKFEEEDIPAYRRWYNQNFGASLSEMRELFSKGDYLQGLLEEIHNVRFFENISFHRAYQKVMDRRNNPEKYAEEDQKHSAGPFDDEDDFFDEGDDEFDNAWDEDGPSHEELMDLFLEIVENNPVLRKACRDEKLFKKLFEEFCANFASKKTDDRGPQPQSAGEGDNHLKSLYRVLVKRLHPDYRKEKNERLDELWNETQEAYKNKDAARLEILVALCDIHTGDYATIGSVSQIMAIQAEYKQRLNALRRKLRVAKNDPAWLFKNPAHHNKMKKELQKKIDADLSQLKREVGKMEDMLKSWSEPAQKKTKTNAKPVVPNPQEKQKPVVMDSDQMNFEF